MTASHKSAHHMYQEAQLLLDMNKHKMALKKFSQLIVEHPTYSLGQWGVGVSLIQMGKEKEGVKELEKGLAAHPQEGMYYYSLGTYYYNIGATKKSIDMATQWLKIHPQNQGAHTLMAKALLRSSDPQKHKKTILEHIHTAKQIDPFDEDVCEVMGEAEWDLNRNKERAIQEYEYAIKINPSDATLRNNFGVMLLNAGEPHRSLEEFRMALQLDPTLNISAENFGRALAAKHPLLGWTYQIGVYIGNLPIIRNIPSVARIIIAYVLVRIFSIMDPTGIGLGLWVLFIIYAWYTFLGNRLFLFAFRKGWIK